MADNAAVNTIKIYSVLAAIAMAANICTQELFIHVYRGALSLLLSVAAGTAVGLAVKYVLDKRFIFNFRARNWLHDGRLFFLYTVMGLATTGVFWATEFGFHLVFETRAMRYLGALLGLGLGYFLKYHLDKKFVFRDGGT